MSEPQNETQAPEADAEEPLDAQMRQFRALAALLLLACLVVSICLNVYVVCANVYLKKRVVDYQELRNQAMQKDMFMSRLMRDLQFLGQTNEGLRPLLIKYRIGAPTAMQSETPAGAAQPPQPNPPPVPGQKTHD